MFPVVFFFYFWKFLSEEIFTQVEEKNVAFGLFFNLDRDFSWVESGVIG